MGREAQCECECNGERGTVKALIEPPDLILRGEIRRRLPFSQLTQVRTDGRFLRFLCGPDTFVLALGVAMAEKWAKALTTPPPTLAKKLGISADTVVHVIGTVDDDALLQALSSAKALAAEDAEVIVARVNSSQELAFALRAARRPVAARVPIWFIYPKGPGHPLNEKDVRSSGLAFGLVDTKVASVSPTLTALRFIRSKEP